MTHRVMSSLRRVHFSAPFLLAALLSLGCADNRFERDAHPPFNVLVMTSKAKDHLKMIAAAGPMLTMMATDNNFRVTVTDDGSAASDANLAKYDVFVQLQQAPFDLKPAEQAAIQKFIQQGHGWIGIHAAGLPSREYTGPDVPYWQWYEDFLGGITYSPHPRYQQATLIIEDHSHPITRHLPDKMVISDEWYEFDKSPRPNVRVLAHVDESTYHQNKPMGDHPMIWVNEKYHRAAYICIGHDPTLCENRDFQVLVRDSILWASDK